MMAGVRSLHLSLRLIGLWGRGGLHTCALRSECAEFKPAKQTQGDLRHGGTSDLQLGEKGVSVWDVYHGSNLPSSFTIQVNSYCNLPPTISVNSCFVRITLALSMYCFCPYHSRFINVLMLLSRNVM